MQRRPLTPDITAIVDFDGMCALVDEQSLMLCRAVQRNISADLASPTIA